eukprot:11156446-Lingulodinium_polyedra.AAC.1
MAGPHQQAGPGASPCFARGPHKPVLPMHKVAGLVEDPGPKRMRMTWSDLDLDGQDPTDGYAEWDPK